MGQKVSREDFEWSYSDEPHASRRKEILRKHPEIKQLMGHDPWLKWQVLVLVVFQLASLFLVRRLSLWAAFVMAYCLGGVINHSLTLAIHEISHNLAFSTRNPMRNRLFGFFANLPIGVPMSISFRKYHLDHHKYQGDNDMDADLPTELEAKLFNRTSTKFLWVLLQPFFYSLRPMCVRPMPIEWLEVVNIVIQLVFDLFVVHFFGWPSLAYLVGGTLLAMGLHPVAGHFISEHYMFEKGYETYSYYGLINRITFNVGYHNEHHDFPNIPGCRLPLVRQIAPEFYENLPSHNSFVKVIHNFILDPNIGLYSRVKRVKKLAAK